MDGDYVQNQHWHFSLCHGDELRASELETEF